MKTTKNNNNESKGKRMKRLLPLSIAASRLEHQEAPEAWIPFHSRTSFVFGAASCLLTGR